MPAKTKPRRGNSDLGIIAIGLFKLLKCVLLLALGVTLIYWRNKDLGEVASRLTSNLWLSRSYFDHVLFKLSFVSRETIDQFAIGSFVYAILLAIEGVGLCLRKRWAEFLTVGITASLLPLELYHLSKHVSAWGVIVTLLNIAIVVYLAVRLYTSYRPNPRTAAG